MKSKTVIIASAFLLLLVVLVFVFCNISAEDRDEETRTAQLNPPHITAEDIARNSVSGEKIEVPFEEGPDSDYETLTFPDNTLDTSDWKTYRNEEYGFEFDYPSDWEVYVDNTAISSPLLLSIDFKSNSFDELNLRVFDEVTKEVETGIQIVKDGQTARTIEKSTNKYGTEFKSFYTFKEAKDLQLLHQVYVVNDNYMFNFGYHFAIYDYDVAESIIKSFRTLE